MANQYCRHVNVFQGSGEIDLPKPEGVAAAWHFIKGLAGNTHPGAALPFGKLTCGCYNAGYPTGYGNHEPNYGEPIRKFGGREETLGFSHLHQSGTGAIGVYYNFAVTAPFYGQLRQSARRRAFCGENARPGYYSLRLKEDDILCETTVSPACALHRYTFGGPGGRIAMDFSNGGLEESVPRGSVTLLSPREACAQIETHGVNLYFYACLENGSCRAALWKDRQEADGDHLEFADTDSGCGCVFTLEEPGAAVLKVGISLKSAEKAKQDAAGWTESFDRTAQLAEDAWESYLGRVEIETDREGDLEIFYSNLYHTLIKPARWNGESFLYGQHEFLLDFATLWDMYKTQLPLVFSLYPGISRDIVRTYLHTGKAVGFLPNMLVLSGDLSRETGQARLLAEYMLCDAYYRGVPGIDWEEALDVVRRDLDSGEFREFQRTGTFPRMAHLLDLAEGSGNLAALARQLGQAGMAGELEACHRHWRNAFSPRTGLTRAGVYYEGNRWNYSFRPMREMGERMELAGGPARFAALLDRFFGFAKPRDVSGRFEGFNNESDMEAPYAYWYAGRHDRLCEVIDAGLTYMFTAGRGGIPGNNDSGGLSSCYLWNMLGVFPVSGQDLMLIGSPHVRRAALHLAGGRDFVIEKRGEGIYVEGAWLDGRALAPLSFTAAEMMRGGLLRIDMKTRP